MIPSLIRAFEASAAVAAYKIVKFSDTAASSKIALASTNADPFVGVSGSIATVSGDMTDVILTGIGLVTLGGTVTAGAILTSDASGNAIVAVPTAAVFMSIIGRTLAPGVAGDVVEVLLENSAFYRGA